MAGLQCGEGRMMIDSVVWAQNINIAGTDTQKDRQPRRHAIANAAPAHCVGRQKSIMHCIRTGDSW